MTWIVTPEYRAWANMKQRCYNPKASGYGRYGGKGVTVCERWRESYCNFLADMGPRPSSDHSIDRIDGSRGYSPDNCRWAPHAVQSANRRRPIWDAKARSAHRVCGQPPALSPQKVATANKRRLSGWSIRRLSEHYGVSRNTIVNWTHGPSGATPKFQYNEDGSYGPYKPKPPKRRKK